MVELLSAVHGPPPPHTYEYPEGGPASCSPQARSRVCAQPALTDGWRRSAPDLRWPLHSQRHIRSIIPAPLALVLPPLWTRTTFPDTAGLDRRGRQRGPILAVAASWDVLAVIQTTTDCSRKSVWMTKIKTHAV